MSCKPTATLPSHLSIGQTVSNSAHWGIVITPDKPEFHENFPTNIYVSPSTNLEYVVFNEDFYSRNNYLNYNPFQNNPKLVKEQFYNYRGGHFIVPVSFYIIPSNLNYVPVYDHDLNKFTNGVGTLNHAFDIETDEFREYYNQPTFTNIYRWKMDGWYNPVVNDIKDGFRIYRIDFDEGYYYGEQEYNSGIIRWQGLSVDKHTGHVKGFLTSVHVDNPENETFTYPMRLKIQNGNGESFKDINLVISRKSPFQYSPSGTDSVHQMDLPIPSGSGGFTYDLNGDKIYK